MKIVLTGGAGYIGSHILLELLAGRHSVMVIDNFSKSSPETLKRIRTIAKTDFSITVGSITNDHDLERCFTNFSEATIIHCAGLKSPSESQSIPLSYYSENVGGTIKLLAAMDTYKCKNIIFSSSASIYGNNENSPVNENSRPNPNSVYAKTKYMAEQIIEDWCALENNRSCVSLRYFNPVGADASGLIGEDFEQRPNNLMPHILNAASNENDRLAIFGCDYNTRDGTGERDYIHVTDLAEAHMKALEFGSQENGYFPINVGTGKGVTVLELIEYFEKTTNTKVPYYFSKRREGDLARSIAGIENAKNLLSWEAKKSVQEMCNSAWLWYKKSKA